MAAAKKHTPDIVAKIICCFIAAKVPRRRPIIRVTVATIAHALADLVTPITESQHSIGLTRMMLFIINIPA